MSADRPTNNAIPPARFRKRRLLAWVCLFGFILVGTLLYDHFTDPKRIESLATAYLQRYTQGEVEIDAASFSWFDGIHLFGVAVYDPEDEPAGASAREPVFFCREIRLTHDASATLLGSPRIRSVLALQPTFTITRDVANDHTNLSALLRRGERADPDAALPDELPRVEFRDARVRVVSLDKGKARTLEDLRLTLRARPAPKNPKVYDVTWQERGERRASGHTRINLETGTVRNEEGGWPWMSIEAVMLTLNAGYDGVGAWCDLLGLEGTVRVEDYNLAGGDGIGVSRSATIRLANAALSIPINEEELALGPADRYLHFVEVNGQVKATSDGLTAEFSGKLHGARCTVSTTIRAGVEKLNTLDDVDFDARLSFTDLVLPRLDSQAAPAEARFIRHWPALERFFRNYDPRVVLDLEIDVEKKAGANTPTKLRRMLFTAKSGDVRVRFFPYPVREVAGVVEYTPQDGVNLRNLQGRRLGGLVTVNGHMDSPTRQSAKSVIITGAGIPIDTVLFESLPPRFQSIRERFDPSGKVDVKVVLELPAATKDENGEWERARWKSLSTISLLDVSATYVGFPYPLNGITGTLEADRDKVRISDLVGRSGASRVRIDGVAAFAKGKEAELDLDIRGENVSFDDALMAALPDDAREKVERFHPVGKFDVQTQVSRDVDTGKANTVSHVTLKNVTIQHQAIPLKCRDLQGRLRISGGEVVVEGVTGRYLEATVLANGRVDSSGAQMVLKSHGLPVDEQFMSALPSAFGQRMGGWEFQGPVNLEVVYNSQFDPDSSSSTLSAELELIDTRIMHPSFPLPFEKARGLISIDGEGARASGLEAMYDTSRLRLDFNIRREGVAEEGTLTLSVADLDLNGPIRDLLPEDMAATWDQLSPSGIVDLHLQHLDYSRPSAHQPRQWSVTGYAELKNVIVPSIAGLKDASGVVWASGAISDRSGGTSLDGTLRLSHVSILGQPFTDAEATWSLVRGANGDGVMDFDSIVGRIHGGTLTGRVETTIHNQQVDYDLALKVRAAQIQPLVATVHEAERGKPPESKAAEIEGLLNGQFYLRGEVGNASARRGGGRFEVLEGRIYRLPIILEILRWLSLTIPEDHVFDDVRTSFFIVGDQLQLKDIQLRGGTVALVGSGSMSILKRSVDLNLVYVNPRDLIRVPIFTSVVEELSRKIVPLHVTGTLSKPTVRNRTLSGFQDAIESLFIKKKSRRIQPTGP